MEGRQPIFAMAGVQSRSKMYIYTLLKQVYIKVVIVLSFYFLVKEKVYTGGCILGPWAT